MISNYVICSVNVTEDVGEVVLTVRRNQGTVGRVSAIALITDLGATADQDYNRTNYEVSINDRENIMHIKLNACIHFSSWKSIIDV